MKTRLLFAIGLLLMCVYSITAQTTYTYTLINADTDLPALSNFSGNINWDLDQAYGLNLISDVGAGTYTKVKFTISNGRVHAEGGAPYAAYADIDGDYGNAPGHQVYFGWYPEDDEFLTFEVEYFVTQSDFDSDNAAVTDTFSITFYRTGNDIIPPSEPTLTVSGQTDTTVDLIWSGASDLVGVTGYKVFKDGSLEATLGNVTNYHVTGLSASTTYDFKVRALDAANNESPDSNVENVTTDSSSGSSVWSNSSGTASYLGNVGVGVSSVPAGYQMAVDGKIIAEEIRVELSTIWPDYVFKDGYNLPTLEEIKSHVDTFGHLPNIPSAAEVEKSGIPLGEMNRLLLEKIEELTLHLIQLNAEITNLKNQTSRGSK